MISFESKGIVLEQNKEPALSRSVQTVQGLNLKIDKTVKSQSKTPELLAPHEIVAIAKEAGIIDESDGRRLWKKLSQATRESVSGIVVEIGRASCRERV